MEQPPESQVDIGDVIARVRDLNDRRVPPKEILAKLAEFDAPRVAAREPFTRGAVITDHAAETAALGTQLQAFIAEHGLVFEDSNESISANIQTIEIPLSLAELEALKFMHVLGEDDIMAVTSYVCNVKTKDGKEITLWIGEGNFIVFRSPRK